MSYKILETCIGCTACVKRCPTDAITGVRNGMHIIHPELCIDCGACGVVCPVECIADEFGDIGKGFPRREWPKAIVIEDNCIGSGCELCIHICQFDALELDVSGKQVGDFFGVARLIEKKCTGCRLCEEACGWDAIYIDPPREALKKRIYEPIELVQVDTAASQHSERPPHALKTTTLYAKESGSGPGVATLIASQHRGGIPNE